MLLQVVAFFVLSGLVEIPLVVGSVSGLGGPTSLSHMVPRTVFGSSLDRLGSLGSFAFCRRALV